MRLPYSLLGLILVIVVCVRAVHTMYVGYMKAPRMIKEWKEKGDNDAVAKWENILNNYRKKYIPITVGTALLGIVGLSLFELGRYLEDYFSSHPPH